MPDVRMPDGVVVRFPDDLPPEQIRDMIKTKFPQVTQQQQAQAAPMPLPRPSFMQRQPVMPPVPRPRPAARGAGGPDIVVDLPDGGTASFPAGTSQKVMEGALQKIYPKPSQEAGGDMIKINIEGQPVNVGREFLTMSREMQDQTIDEIAAEMGVHPKGASTSPLLDQIAGALRKADAAGNTADAQALADAYRQVQSQMPQQGGGAGQQPNGSNAAPGAGGPMQRFEVKTPDGQTYEVTAPDQASAVSAIQQYLGGAGRQAGGKLQEFRRQYPQYGDMNDQQLADAVYRKFYSDMPRAQFDTQLGLTPAAAGPSKEWLAQNPSLADLPIPGTVNPTATPAGAAAKTSGAFENATAGLNTAIYSVAGFPVDAANTALRMGAAGVNAATGSNIQLPEHTPGGRQSIAKAFSQIGVRDPATIEPANNFERSLRAGGEGAGYAIAPELMLAQLSKLGIVGAKAQQLLGQIFGEARNVRGTAGNMVAGATGGAGAQVAADAAPEEWTGTAALGGGLVGAGVGTLATQLPRLAGAGGKLFGDFVAPFTQGGRERMAGQQLRDGATSPGGVIDAIANAPSELVPGSHSTAFQMTGDMGLGAMERGVAARNPVEFQQRRSDQNAARLDAIENLQPTGAPETIVAAVRSHIKQIDDELEATVSGATRAARGKVAAIGQGAAPDIAGGNIRNSLEAARLAAKERERALWKAVDPDGTLSLSTTTTRSEAARILRETPASAKPPEGEEAAIMGIASQYGDTMPFSEITALQSRTKTAMRAERIASGESTAYARLSQMNGALQQDLETAIAGKVQQEAKAVAAGQMRPEETFEAWLKQDAERWFTDRNGQAVSGGGEAGPVGFAGGRQNAVPSVRGTASQGPGGFGGAAGNPRLSPDAAQPNFDRAALERLTTARQATKQRVETFDNGTLGPIRRRPGTTSPYDMPVSAVPAQIFNPSPKSVDALRSYRAAVGDGPALSQLQDFAIDRLRKAALREDGTFDPGKVASWRRSHADVLRSFPQLDASLADAARASETMATVVTARDAARAETQRGVLGRMMGLNSPDDVTRAVGSIFGRQDSQNLMMKLRQAIGKNAEATEGLRKAVVDYVLDRFVGNTEAATSRLGTIKSDQFQTFIARNKGALHLAGFGDDEIKMMDNIAEDLQRANRSIASVRLPGGSNTAQDVMAARFGKDGSVLLKIILASAGSGAGIGLLSNSVTGAAAMLGAGLIGAMRQKGIHTVDDLVKDALLNPSRARSLMVKASPGNIKLVGPSLAQQYRRAAMSSIGASATP